MQVTDRTVGANPTGFDMRTEINNIIGALESDNSGSSAPLNTVAYMKWLDTSNATYYYVKERNHDNTAWVTLFRYTVATKIMEAVSNGVVLSQTNIASEIHASSSKTTPVDADEIGLIDSASTFTLKKLTWANLKATLKTYFDTLYVSLSGNQTIAGIKTFSSFPITPSSAPITDYQVANKKYADDLVSVLTFEKIVQGTAVNSTSGTSIDFTGIPSWAKKITVMFNGVSTSGTSPMLVQLGDSGGIENTTYVGNVWSGAGAGQHSIGFVVQNNMIALQTQHGSVRINLFSGNTFIEDGNVGPNLLANAMSVSCGSKTLSSTLDRIRVTTVNGTDTFDAGQINIMYEG